MCSLFISQRISVYPISVRFFQGLTIPLIIALVVRGLALGITPGALETDVDLYRQLASNLVIQGSFALGGRPTAFRPPIYPILLAPCMLLGQAAWWGIALLHISLGLVTVVGVYFVARELGGPRIAWLAALLVGVDPLLVWQSTQLMSETAVTAVVTIAFVLAIIGVKIRCPSVYFLFGVVVGLASLTRANLLPWSLVSPLLLALCRFLPLGEKFVASTPDDMQGCGQSRTQGSRRLLTRCLPTDFGSAGEDGTIWRKFLVALLFGYVGTVAALLPWGLRNRIVLGRWIFGTTHGGVTFFLANNDFFYDHLAAGRPPGLWTAEKFQTDWISRVRQKGIREEPEIDEYAYQLAWETIKRRPGLFVAACALRISWLWSPVPNVPSFRFFTPGQLIIAAVAAFYLFSYLMVLIALPPLCKRWRGDPMIRAFLTLGLMLVIVLSFVHALYWSNLRMRAPAIPLLVILAAIGWGKCEHWFRGWWDRARKARISGDVKAPESQNLSSKLTRAGKKPYDSALGV